jgi:hypothetical protein
MTHNPFGVLSPEQLDTNYIADNFVDVFTDFPRVREPGNTFISGARGTGKSMLLRSLEPEVLVKSRRISSIERLDFFGIHVPLRKAEFGIPELRSLTGYPSIVIGEHLLVMQVCYRIAAALERLAHHMKPDDARKLAKRFQELLVLSGYEKSQLAEITAQSSQELIATIKSTCEQQIIETRQYYKRLPLSEKPGPYNGPLTGFLDFLIPVAETISTCEIFKSKPLFVMLDDADNLPVHLQKIINSWISTRSTHAICLKISTQLAYATYRTVDNRVIESPHDFSEVNLSSLYTSDTDSYFKRVEKIISRRLQLAQIQKSPREFFPRDNEQENRLEIIRQQIESQFAIKNSLGEKQSGPARVRDLVSRTAVPTLMRELAGSSKSSHTFSYAGFDSLVNLSSGVVRWFLEPASRMYDKVVSENAQVLDHIPTKVQDQIVDDWAREFLQKLSVRKVADFEEYGPDGDEQDSDASLHALGHETVLYDKLKNLVDGLGQLFRQRILDANASEQRLLSVILRGRPSEDLASVLGLGVRLGYLQLADYAAKEVLGLRHARYILSRRLGPYYKLDVSGYAAHLSVTSEDLEVSLENPIEFVRRRLKLGDKDSAQLRLGLEERE